MKRTARFKPIKRNAIVRNRVTRKIDRRLDLGQGPDQPRRKLLATCAKVGISECVNKIRHIQDYRKRKKRVYYIIHYAYTLHYQRKTIYVNIN